MKKIIGLSEIAHKYQFYVIDIVDVLHDYVSVFSEALACLKSLKNDGKKIFLVSNASFLSPTVRKKIAGFGITEAYYDFLLTAGDAFNSFFETIEFPEGWPDLNSCYVIGEGYGYKSIEGLPLRITNTLEEADFLLLTDNVSNIEDISADYFASYNNS